VKRARGGEVAQPRGKPEEGFFREYSSLLIEKLEDQLITAEENSKLLEKNSALQRELELKNADLNATNEEMLRANQDLEAFSYSVSHDLRAPVRAIQGMLALLVEEIGTGLTPQAKFFVQRIEHNAERMNALITGLLAHSRMRNVGAALAPVDLSRVVAAAMAALDFAVQAAGAKIQIGEPLPQALGHEQALIQVLTNLLENALKFVAAGVAPKIDIRATQKDGRVRLQVRDNGIGIASEYHPRLFQVFERLSSDPRYQGSGLGLAIVRRGIERMGGKVGVESSPENGSTFWIDLKAAS